MKTNNAIKIDINSGVHAGTGFDFQRNSCIYVFLEKYDSIKNLNYFIMLEHYDDIVFGFLNEHNKLEKLTTYQAKKASSKWTKGSLYEILKQIMNVGIEVAKDSIDKCTDYKQNHYFLTNNTISINYKENKENKNYHIKETNELVKISDLDDIIQTELKKGDKKNKFTNEELEHFSNIHLRFIDLGRNSNSQRSLLIGRFIEVFKDEIIDHQAALDTLILHLKKIETKFNQGEKLHLSDQSKRINSTAINEIISVLTTNKLAIEYCRNNAQPIYNKLKIGVFDQSSFLLEYENSLDRFKDLTQAEHQKIFNYLKSKKIQISNHYDLADAILDMYSDFNTKNNTTLNEIQLKASIASGCFLIVNMK